MTAILKVESRDIRDLTALQLTRLLKLLLCLEARSFGIAQRAVDVALNITVADGGEDGRIRWRDGPSETDYLPSRFVQFQIKATDMGPPDCAKELVNKDGAMKPMVDEALESGAAYVLFVSREYNESQKQDRIDSIRGKLAELGKPYAETATIEIYDAAKIEGWANNFISATVATLNWVGRPLAQGLKTWEEWSKYNEYNRFPFVADTYRQEAIAALKTLLAGHRKCARIIGLSGLGKTRLAFEVFRESEGSDFLNEQVVYIDANANQSLLGLVSDWVRGGTAGILVIDNCDLRLHEGIKKEILRLDSKLSALTLDYNLERSSQTDLVQLKQLSDPHIKQMLEPVYGKQIPDLDRIVSFAQGFPQMAVLLADARLDREPEMGRLTDDELARKMLWGGREPKGNDEKILRGCALFDRFGLDDDVAIEYEFIASNIVVIEVDEFYDCIKRFEERGLIDRRGRFARLVPKPLAIRLAAEWWRRTRKERQLEVINSEMPGGLLESFCNQIARLDFLPEVKALVEDMCGPQGPFGRAEVILSDGGSTLFRSLVEVNPEVTSRALSNVLSNMNDEGLSAIRGDVRRNLVWSLEKLCFHKACFEESANSLLLLAGSENESWANNATGQFKQLFRAFLSGTEAPPALRLKVIDSALRSNRESIRRVAVEALEMAIDIYGGTRTLGAEYQGSGEPLEEWRPKIWGEIFEYWDEALQRLTRLVTNKDPLASLAKKSIASHIRGLMQYGRMDSLNSTIEEIVKSDGPLWPEALDSIKSSLSYDAEKMPQEGQAKLNEWVNLLAPTQLREKLRLYVTKPPYEHIKGEDGHYIDIAQERAKSLAVELAADLDSLSQYLDDLLVGEQRASYTFGRHLVEAAQKWEPILSLTVNRVRQIENPNISFLLGVLNGIYNLDHSKWESTVRWLSEIEGVLVYYPDFANSGKVTPGQLHFSVDLVKQRKLEPVSVSTFIFGRSLGHLPSTIVSQFVKDLASVSNTAAWVGLHILTMYCYGNRELWEQCRGTFKTIVVNLPLDKDLRQDQMDIYNWQHVVEKLLISEDEEFALEISRRILSASSEKMDYSDLWHYVQPLLRSMFNRHGRAVWQLFSEAIKTADSLRRFWLAELLGCGTHFGKDASCVLAELPDELLREWCIQEPDVAPAFVAQATDALLDKEAGTQISPRARFLIDYFGDDKRVLAALSANLGTFGWTGSLVPYYRRELMAMEGLVGHEKLSVREWASRRIEYLNKVIKGETRRDEEHDWGIH